MHRSLRFTGLLALLLCAPALAAKAPPPATLPVVALLNDADRDIAAQAAATIDEVLTRLREESIEVDHRWVATRLRRLVFTFRGPDGQGGYRYGSASRDPELPFETAHEARVTLPGGGGEQVVQATVKHYSDLRLAVPEKRNLWHDNGPVLLHWVKVTTPDFPNRGRQELNLWLSPGQHHELPPEALDQAVTLQWAMTTTRDMDGKALLTVEGRPFAFRDADNNPFLSLSQKVQALQPQADAPLRQVNVQALVSGLEPVRGALGTITPPAPAPAPEPAPAVEGGTLSRAVLVSRLNFILSLMQGNDIEQKQAITELERFLDELR